MASKSNRKVKRLVFILVMTLLVVGSAVAGLTWLYGGVYAQGIIRTKLQTIVSGHLNARLEMGAVNYQYPLGVVVRDVSLVSASSDEPEVTLASFKEMRLQLARSPLAEGPLVIKSVELESPTVHVIRDADRLRGMRKLLRSDDDSVKSSAPRLSEVFQLRYLKVIDARIQYEDRRVASTVPLLWEHLDAEINSTPTSGAVHAYQFAAHAGTLAEVTSAGALDIDTLVLQVDQFKLRAAAQGDSTSSPLPPQVQTFLKQFGVSGEVELQVAGTLPLLSLKENAVASASVSVRNARAVIPKTGRPLEQVDVSVTGAIDHGKVDINTGIISFRYDGTGVSLQPVQVQYSLVDRRWTATELRGAIARRPTEPPKDLLTQPVTLVLRAGVTQAENLTGVRLNVDGTRLTFDTTNQTVELSGTLLFDASSLQLTQATIKGFGGTTAVSGTLDTDTRDITLDLKTDGVELEPIKAIVQPLDPDPMAGRLVAETKLAAKGSSIDSITGIGAARITGGRFARIPILARLVSFIGIGQGLFVADEAQAQFTIGDKKIHFDRVAVSTSAVRIAGRGQIGLDKSIDLRLYAATSNKWGKGVTKTGVPMLSEFGGMVVGGAEKVINGVSSQVSAMHATGTLEDPVIRPSPVPAFTGALQNLFNIEEK